MHEAVSSLIEENLETSGAPERIDNQLSPPSFSDGDNSHETDYADLIGKINVDGDDNIKEGKNADSAQKKEEDSPENTQETGVKTRDVLLGGAEADDVIIMSSQEDSNKAKIEASDVRY